jgi:predicted anti-sigma-YlaC factor YlaD
MIHSQSFAAVRPVRAVTYVSFFRREPGTNRVRQTTECTMEPIDCEAIRETLSARADREATRDELALADVHLTHCPDCRQYAADLERIDRMIRVRPAEPVPNLVGSVTARVRPAQLGRGGWLRPALAWVAVVMLVQSLPALLLGETSGTSPHLARHLGAFGAALAIGFAYAAWKPHRAFGLLPFTAALVATTSVSIVADLVTGSRTPLAELIHVTELAGLALLWMVAGSPGWRHRGHSRRRRLPQFDPQ